MTEAEWLTCRNPAAMLDHLQDKASDRKLRLFACACCRRIWHALDEPARQAVEVAECYAEEAAEYDDLMEASAAADLTARAALFGQSAASVAFAGAKAAVVASGSPADRIDAAASAEHAAFAAYLAKLKPGQAAALGYGELLQRAGDDGQEACAQCRLLRELIGNPFQPIIAESTWLTWNYGTVPKMARSILRDGAFDRLPILADALEDAGCDNADILPCAV